MRLPDAASALGANLVEAGPPDPGTERTAAASSHLHDSSDQHVRALGMAGTADSTSYDTDMDTHNALVHSSKLWQPFHLAQPGKPAASRPFPLCLAFRGFPVDGEGPSPPHGLPTCGDFVRYISLQAHQALRRLGAILFKSPEGADGSAGQGALGSLVARQIRVSLTAWEAYDEEQTERKADACRWTLLHPLCGFAMGWSTAMLVFDLVFTAFWVPVNVAFCLEQYGNLDAACTRTDLAGGIVYVVNILLGFLVGVTLTCGYRSRVVVDGRDAARFYASTLTFWLDLLAVAPFFYLIAVLGMGDTVARHQTVSIVSLIRLVRLFRVASLIKQLYSSSSSGEMQSSWVADHFTVTPMYMVLLTYMASVLVNLYSCLLLLLAYYEQLRDKPSWMSSISWTDVAAQEGAHRWYSAVYFCITVMTTTGYADFVPKSPAEQVLVSFIMLNGLVIFGAVVALIGSALKRSQEVAQRAHDDRKRLTDLRHWLQEGKVPDPVCRDVITFFGELSARRDHGRTESDIVFELPSHLRQKVSRHVVLGLLSQCAPLAGLPLEVRELLASHCVPLELPTGHDVFRLGYDVEAGGGGLWVLEEGVVVAYRNKERLEMPVGPTGLAVPCLLGEGSVLSDIIPACGFRMWTLRTERPCRIWQLRDPALRAALQIYPALASHIMLFVRDRIMAWLSEQDDREEEGWCELVQVLKRSFIMGPLRERSQDCYLALQLASLSDGTLTQLLAAWLEMSVNQEMILEDPLDEGDVTEFNFGAAAAAWVPRAATANIITPAATPEQHPASPDPSTVAGRAALRFHGSAVAFSANSGGSALTEAGTTNATAVVTESMVPRECEGTAVASPRPTPSASPMPLRGAMSGLPEEASCGDGDCVGGGTLAGGGGAVVPVGLPMPPAEALASTVSTAVRPVYPRRLRSDSGRPSWPSVPSGTEEQWAPHTVDGGRGSRVAGGIGGGRRGRGHSGVRSENGALSPRPGLQCPSGNTAADHDPVSGLADLPIDGADAIVAAAAAGERSSAPAGATPAAIPLWATGLGPAEQTSGAPSFGSAAALPLPSGRSPFVALATATPQLLSGSATSGALDGVLLLPQGSGTGHRERHQSPSGPARPPASPVSPTSQGAATVGGSPSRAPGSLQRVASLDNGAGLAASRQSSRLQRSVSSGPNGRVAAAYEMNHAAVAASSSQHVWQGINGGAETEAAGVRATPDSPEGNQGRNRTSAVAYKTGQGGLPHPPSRCYAQPQALPPAAALVRQVSSGRTTFMHKIFLAAGVNLQPLVKPSEATVAATAGAPTAPAAVNILPPQGPTILAPACTYCGCATCAYCAHPIVPRGAVMALQHLEPVSSHDAMIAGGALSTATGATAAASVSVPTAAGAAGHANGISNAVSTALQSPPHASASPNQDPGASMLSNSRLPSFLSGQGAVSRQPSGVIMSGVTEFGGPLPSGSSAARLPLLSAAYPAAVTAPRSPVNRLRLERTVLGPSSLARAGSQGLPKLPPPTATVVQPRMMTRLRSSSGANTINGGVFIGGAISVGIGRGRNVGAVGDASDGGSLRSGGGGELDGSGAWQLTPGAALAAVAASISAEPDRDGEFEGDGGGNDSEVGVASGATQQLRRSDAGLADALLPRSGTIRII